MPRKQEDLARLDTAAEAFRCIRTYVIEDIRQTTQPAQQHNINMNLSRCYFPAVLSQSRLSVCARRMYVRVCVCVPM